MSEYNTIEPKPQINSNFSDRLIHAVQTKKSRIIVGLDPRLKYIPTSLCEQFIKKFGLTQRAIAEVFLEFNRQIIDEIAIHSVAIKPQVAFYEQYGDVGIWALIETIKYAKSKGILVIADGKRNDIGSTAQAYANAYLGKVDFWHDQTVPIFDVDALTINPYLGFDGIEPFRQVAIAEGKGLFILARTSNPASGEIQELQVDGEYLFEKIAHLINDWGKESEGVFGYRSIGAVVGATYPIQAKRLRKMMPKCFFLVPGYGAQGATPENVRLCFNQDGYGAIVNSSRDIIFAYMNEPEKSQYSPEEFALAAGSAAKRMKDSIEKILN